MNARPGVGPCPADPGIAPHHGQTSAPSAVRAAPWVFAAVVMIAVAGLFTVNIVTHDEPWLNHDVAFHAWLGQEIFHGAHLYTDIDDTNPPGAPFVLGALVAGARAVGAPVFLALHGFVLALGAGGLALLARTLGPPARWRAALLVVPAYLLVIVHGNFGNSLFPAFPDLPYDFGQREHVFSLLFVPYLVWRVDARRSPRWLWPYWLALGYLSMLKPYWPPMVAAVEIFAWRAGRARDGATPLVLATGAVLPLVVLVLHSPASAMALLRDVVPLHLSGDYAHYDATLRSFLVSPVHARIGLVLLVFCAWWVAAWRSGARGRTELALWLGLVVWTYASVLHQHKFWSYHAMVTFALATVGSAHLAAHRLAAAPPGRPRRLGTWAVAAVLVVLVGAGVERLGFMLRELRPFGAQLVSLLRGHDKVMFVSMSVDFSYAPVYHGLDTVGPWSVHFRLPALLELDDPEVRERELAAYADRVRDCIERERPELILFAPYRQALPAGLTLHALFAGRGVVPPPGYRPIPAARLAGIDPGLAGWTVYERTDA